MLGPKKAFRSFPWLRRAKAGLRSLLLFGAATGTYVFGPLLRKVSSPKGDGGSFILIRLDLLGDIVFSLSAARAIKEVNPESRVTMVTLPQMAAVARLSPDVNRVVSLDTNLIRSPKTLFRLATLQHLALGLKELRGIRARTTFSMYGLTASLLAMLTKADSRIGFADEAYPGSLDRTLLMGRVADRRRRHDTEFVHRLVEGEFPGAAATAPRPAIPYSRDCRQDALMLLSRFGIKEADSLVLLHSGSSYGNFKRWPPGSFRSLGIALAERGYAVGVIGGPADSVTAAELAADSPLVSFAGETSLDCLVGLFHHAKLIVSGDSGPLHLATVIGTPAVAIYGPTDPKVNGPIAWAGQSVTVLRKDIVCSPCYSVRTRAECPLGHNICMDLVTVEEVLAACFLSLKSGPGLSKECSDQY